MTDTIPQEDDVQQKSFVLVEFADINSVQITNMIINRATPLQVAALALMLEFESKSALSDDRQRRKVNEVAIPKIAIPGR